MSNRIKFIITLIIITLLLMFSDFYVLGNITTLIGDSIGERVFTWFWYIFISSIISYLLVYKIKGNRFK